MVGHTEAADFGWLRQTAARTSRARHVNLAPEGHRPLTKLSEPAVAEKKDLASLESPLRSSWEGARDKASGEGGNTEHSQKPQ